MLTQEQVNDAHAYGNKIADDKWYCGGTLIGDEGRRRLFAATIRRFQDSVSVNPNTKPDAERIIGEVKADPELKGFVPIAMLLGWLLSWIVGKLLDYLWNKYSGRNA